MYKNDEDEVKVESLLIWIASLLDFHLIDDSIDEWYLFFENILAFYVSFMLNFWVHDVDFE